MQIPLLLLCSLICILSRSFAIAVSKPELVDLTLPSIKIRTKCLLPYYPTVYSCADFRQVLELVAKHISDELKLSTTNKIVIDASFVPFCDESMYPTFTSSSSSSSHTPRRCDSAGSHSNALAFASSSKFYELKDAKVADDDFWLYPSVLVKQFQTQIVDEKEYRVDWNEDDVDITVQFRTDFDRFWLPVEKSVPIKPSQLDLRLTLLHELLHGFALSFTGLSTTEIIPGVLLPSHFTITSDWYNWTASQPMILKHLADITTTPPTPLSLYTKKIMTGYKETNIPVDRFKSGFMSSGVSYDLSKKLYQLATTPDSVAFQIQSSDSKYVTLDTHFPNYSPNSLTHLSDAYRNTSSFFMVTDTASYTGMTLESLLSNRSSSSSPPRSEMWIGRELIDILKTLGYNSHSSSDSSPKVPIPEKFITKSIKGVAIAVEKIKPEDWNLLWFRFVNWSDASFWCLIAITAITIMSIVKVLHRVRYDRSQYELLENGEFRMDQF